jgi:hypothetical protein
LGDLLLLPLLLSRLRLMGEAGLDMLSCLGQSRTER